MIAALSILNLLLIVPAILVALYLFALIRDTRRRSGEHNVFARRVSCPRCNLLMPVPRKPSSFRQAMLGGWTCESCGCEMDAKGVELLSGK